ncbi:MAG: VacJ family lipoprotein [Nitrosomonadales bacterium]|nr:VacJ family lipoprotein [Nitrosomonadales bacterium]
MNAIRLSLIALVALTSGCASQVRNPADPFEPLNRGIYKFNDGLDKAIVKPVAQGYNTVMPTPGKIMVSNFFSNLDDLIVTANDVLQLKFRQAASDGTRFLFNSTFGLFGLFDVTTRLEKHNEDFGQTLGYWGVGSGPYLVLPLLGPSTLRDGVGLYADGRPSKLRRIKHMRTRNQMYLTKGINRRAQLLDQEKILDEAAIDHYSFLRDAYLQRRESLIYDGNPPREKYDLDEEESQPAPSPQSSAPDQAAPGVATADDAQNTAEAESKSATIYKIWLAEPGNAP